jgi:hypothetical protein
VATLDRPWAQAALHSADALDQLRRQVEGAGAILARVAPLLDVVRGAAPTDPDLAEAWRDNIAQRWTVQRAFAEALAAKSALRPGVSIEAAADTSLALLSPETWTLLTRHRGWSADRWRDWAMDGLRRQLTDLPPAAR